LWTVLIIGTNIIISTGAACKVPKVPRIEMLKTSRG